MAATGQAGSRDGAQTVAPSVAGADDGDTQVRASDTNPTGLPAANLVQTVVRGPTTATARGPEHTPTTAASPDSHGPQRGDAYCRGG